jgi:hypothetical protein
LFLLVAMYHSNPRESKWSLAAIATGIPVYFCLWLAERARRKSENIEPPAEP